MDCPANNHAMESSSSHYGHHAETSSGLLCAGDCGFFGTAANKGFCSQCYNKYLKELVEASRLEIFSPVKILDEKNKNKNTIPSDDDLFELVPNLRRVRIRGEGARTKCECCKKKVGLLGFGCRCGGTFCGAHRYPDSHCCDFDSKISGKIALQKENPVCKADKLRDRI